MSRVLKELGRGSYGCVYLLQTEDFLEFALKVVNPIKEREGDLKEAEILTKYCHPHLVKCHKFFKMRESLYMITEYCGNGTLKDFIDTQKQYVPEKNILRLLCQLSDVLRYLHDSKIIHRDLKPANIFLDAANNVKVGDVGVAKQLDHTFDMVSSIWGTLVYMSPEIRTGKKYTFKTDIWSLGCCVYEVMTLKRTSLDMNEMCELKIPFVSEDVCSKSLQAVVLDMLSLDPGKRPDAHDLLFQACGIRGIRYKSADLVTNIEIEIDPKEICKMVSRFKKANVSSSPSKDSKQEAFDNLKNGDKLRSSGTSSNPKKPFSNLHKDTFGTIPKPKANTHRQQSRTLSADSTESTQSNVGEQQDSADNTLSDSMTRNSSCSRDAESSDDSFASGIFSQQHEDVSSDIESAVTLYTRAQHATYNNRPPNNRSNLTEADLVHCTETVFAGQSSNLKELMLKRVAGVQNYEVNGQPMLHHKHF